MKISCLAITEDRPEFAQWLCWNYLKQDYDDKELVLVASATDKEFIRTVKEQVPDAVIETTAHGAPVPVKRNIAMLLAKGDVITWFDDDDWSSSYRLIHATAKLGTSDCLFPSGTGLYYWDLRLWKARHIKCSAWAYGLYKRELALEYPFNEDQRRATDTKWLAEMKTAVFRRNEAKGAEASMGGHCMAVSHKKNISNSQWKASKMMNRYDWMHVMARLNKEPGEEPKIKHYLETIRDRQGIK